MKPDIIDDLAHGIIHDLIKLKIISIDADKTRKHIDSILRKYVELARACPYAGKKGAPCNIVKEILNDVGKE